MNRAFVIPVIVTFVVAMALGIVVQQIVYDTIAALILGVTVAAMNRDSLRARA